MTAILALCLLFDAGRASEGPTLRVEPWGAVRCRYVVRSPWPIQVLEAEGLLADLWVFRKSDDGRTVVVEALTSNRTFRLTARYGTGGSLTTEVRRR